MAIGFECLKRKVRLQIFHQRKHHSIQLQYLPVIFVMIDRHSIVICREINLGLADVIKFGELKNFRAQKNFIFHSGNLNL